MKRPFSNCGVFLLAASLLAVSPPARAELSQSELHQVEFVQYPGRLLPLSTLFQNDRGQTMRLSECFRGSPVILVPGYFRCPMLCEALSDGLLRALQGNTRQLGRDFRVVYFSIDPNERLAREHKQSFLQQYGRPDSEDGCDFLTGSPQSIAALTNAIGYHYRYDPESREYAHPAGFVVLRPDGRIFRYFFGVVFSAAELQRALGDASRGAQPSVVDKLVLLCFHYNPLNSRYGALVMASLRVLGMATIAGIAMLVYRSEKRARSKNKSGKGP